MLEIFGRHKITKATHRSPNSVRSALNCVLLDMRDGCHRLVATDGKILGVIPLNPVGNGSPGKAGESDVPGLIEHEAFDRAMSGTKDSEARQVHFGDEVVEVRDSNGNLIVSVPRSKATGSFPNYEQVIPRPLSQNSALAICPAQLGKLAATLGIKPTEHVTLHFDTNTDGLVDTAIRVTQKPFAGDDVPHGVIMPAMIQDPRPAARLESSSPAPELPPPATRKKRAAVAS